MPAAGKSAPRFASGRTDARCCVSAAVGAMRQGRNLGPKTHSFSAGRRPKARRRRARCMRCRRRAFRSRRRSPRCGRNSVRRAKTGSLWPNCSPTAPVFPPSGGRGSMFSTSRAWPPHWPRRLRIGNRARRTATPRGPSVICSTPSCVAPPESLSANTGARFSARRSAWLFGSGCLPNWTAAWPACTRRVRRTFANPDLSSGRWPPRPP